MLAVVDLQEPLMNSKYYGQLDDILVCVVVDVSSTTEMKSYCGRRVLEVPRYSQAAPMAINFRALAKGTMTSAWQRAKGGGNFSAHIPPHARC